MARFSYILICLLLAGCGHSIADLPVSERQVNYNDSHREGSCFWASFTTLLRAEGDSRADEFATYAGPAYIKFIPGGPVLRDDPATVCNQLGIRFTETFTGDEEFLHEACNRGPGCAVVVHHGSHCVDLVALDETFATICDPNRPQALLCLDREIFLAEWRECGGYAIRPLEWWEF